MLFLKNCVRVHTFLMRCRIGDRNYRNDLIKRLKDTYLNIIIVSIETKPVEFVRYMSRTNEAVSKIAESETDWI